MIYPTPSPDNPTCEVYEKNSYVDVRVGDDADGHVKVFLTPEQAIEFATKLCGTAQEIRSRFEPYGDRAETPPPDAL